MNECETSDNTSSTLDDENKKNAALQIVQDWNVEQDRKKNHGITVSEAVRLHDEEVAVRGIIVSVSQPFKMIKQKTVVCKNNSCKNRLQIFFFDKPIFSDYPKKGTYVCPECNMNSFNIQYSYVNAVSIRIQDDEPYGELEQLDCLLFEKDTRNVRPGEMIKSKGHIEVDSRKTKLYPILHTQSIEYEDKEELEITPTDIQSFSRFAKMPNLIKRLVTMCAPNVIGHLDKKLGILRSAVAAAEDSKKRGRIHTLLIGPPGVAKSMLAREATVIVPNSRYVTAQNASGKGVTAIIDKENDTTVLRLGAVPQARGSICAINEIGRMNFEDQAFLLDAMEEGKFSLDKYAMHIQIKSPTTIVATANPIGSKWNNPLKISNAEMPLLNPLLDRFDQVFAFNELGSVQENKKYALEKIELDEKNIVHNYNFLRRYLIYAKMFKPKLSAEAQSMLVDFWLQLRDRGIATTRTLDSLFRIAKAHAQLYLSEVVNGEIATEVMLHYSNMTLQYGEIVKEVENPRDAACREISAIISETKAPIDLTTAAKLACKKNEQVKSYFGDRINLKQNSKLQRVREMLVNNPSIKQVNEKPVVLQCFERPVVECDTCDTCDRNSEIHSREESQNIERNREKEGPKTVNIQEEEENHSTSHTSHASHGPGSPDHRNEMCMISAAAVINPVCRDSNVKSEVQQKNKKLYKCFHCGEYYASDADRVKHIEYEHPGKMYYPTPEDFRNRLY